METRVQKWGNSNGIRIPNEILKELKIKTGDALTIKMEDGKIILVKRKTLKELFEEYKGPNLAKEFVWDAPRGREIW